MARRDTKLRRILDTFLMSHFEFFQGDEVAGLDLWRTGVSEAQRAGLWMFVREASFAAAAATHLG